MSSWGADIDWTRDRCQHKCYRDECPDCLARLKRLPRRQCKGQGHVSAQHRYYRLTCEEFDALVKRSEGRCDICGVITFLLVIDHDHDLGLWAVRGLLCPSCNYKEGGGYIERRRGYLANVFHLSLTKPRR